MTLVAMVALAIACWLFRIIFVLLVPPERLPARLRRPLGHLPPAVLAALVAVETDSAVGGAPLEDTAYVLGAVLLIGLVAWRTRSLALSIAVSAAACLVLDLLAVT